MVEAATQAVCPDCGTPLSDEPWAVGLCLSCLLDLARDDTALEAELVAGPREAPTLHFAPTETFTEGEIHGARYRIRSLLGRGGMGEVWRAFDLKLRQDVALKAVRAELTRDRAALEVLRQEVRTAREVISPNVCRVFDLQELDGQELVSMEYIDGTTLQKILETRSPLELSEAQEIAAQFLAGLEAIHKADLVHRDIKPENVMITRAGRVVVMDFGIAKDLDESVADAIAGTPAYMSPEQRQGHELDARSDVFAAGVVLAEMVAPGGCRSFTNRERLWQRLHRETPDLPETPWARVIGRCVDGDPAARFASAAELARALEEVTLRAAGEEDADPYPGLAAYRRDQAKFFFGRELEVEELWKRLRRPHLLAVMAPSGSGKSSFLQAGLLPTLPEDWGAITVTPGAWPFAALGHELGKKLADEMDAVDASSQCEEPEVMLDRIGRWRRRRTHALIIVDQFEELFTQNTPVVQERFAALLGRIPLECDAFVLLSMREDFLYHCQPIEALAPVFSELMALGGLTGNALRRALVQPALKCGYRFESDALVDEMVEEVSHERGALPLLAFAASRLWALRDRESGLITAESYERIGGVGGALAQHAETTLTAIGEEHVGVVRELFQNLVTAQGTRAARDREELLSVFAGAGAWSAGTEGLPPASPAETVGNRAATGYRAPVGGTAAEQVLDTLIDARLLTAYEIPGEGEEAAQQRVELVHESLLSNWPRLVRWRMQDAEGAQLRDDLRQAASRWHEKGRPEDLLWTGTSYQEYQLWRQRYPGGLTPTEEGFCQAMTALAERRRRRRRMVLAMVIAALAVGLGVVLGLWRQAEESRRRAEAEARRAEASKLLALARLELDKFPTGALAYVRRSLELADTPEARRFALEILGQAPVARILEVQNWLGRFSPDGRWLAVETNDGLRVVSSDGELSEPLGRKTGQEAGMNRLGFSEESDILIRILESLAGGPHHFVGVERWRLPGLEPLPYLELAGHPDGCGVWTQRGLPLARATQEGMEFSLLPSPPFPYELAKERYLGRIEGAVGFRFDRSGTQGIWMSGSPEDVELYLRPLRFDEPVPIRSLPKAEGGWRHFGISPDGSRVGAAARGSDEFYVFPTDGQGDLEPLILRGNKNHDPLSWPQFSADNRHLVMVSSSEQAAYLWDLESPLDGKPVVLAKKDGGGGWVGTFDPEGRWLASFHGNNVALWSLRTPHARSIDPQEDPRFSWIGDIAFSADSRWIGSCSQGGGLHLWPLEDGIGRDWVEDNMCTRLAFRPHSDEVVTAREELRLRPADGSQPPQVIGPAGGLNGAVRFDPTGRFLASAIGSGEFEGEVGPPPLTIYDLTSGTSIDLDPLSGCEGYEGRPCRVWFLGFAHDGTLYTGGRGGIRRWDLASRTAEWVVGPGPILGAVDLSRDGQYLLSWIESLQEETATDGAAPEVEEGLFWTDLESRETVHLPDPPSYPSAMAIHPDGQTYALGTKEGFLWLGRVGGGPMHLLVGHLGAVDFLEFSPDGRWVASATQADIRLWPMPDLDQPPLFSLPLVELLEKLDSLTNVEAVEDDDAATGWTLAVGPFPGWRDVPEW